MKQITYYFLSLITAFAVNKASAQETRTSEGMPKIGDFYQSAINLDGKRRLIIPDGRWEVNNVFDDKEGNWHASWKVITLINRDYSSPFRMTVVRYFTASVPRWPSEDCEKKSNVYAFGHDLNGSKGSRSVCSNFFYWSNPQEQIRLTLPRYYNFYWAKALNKLPSEFIQGLSKDQLMLEIGASQGGGLYIRQDVLIDAQSIGVNAEDFKLGFTSIREGTNSKAILNWRTSYVQAVSKAFLDSQEISQAAYAFKSPTAAPNNNVTATNTEINKVEKIDSKSNLQNAQKNHENSVTEIELNEIAQERKKIELEKKILEERKKLDEEKRKLEEEKKLAEIDAIKRQKELLALQEERSQLEQKQLQKLQEDRLRQEKIAATQADAKAKLDEERARKEQERALAEEAKKREEAERKEVTERRRAAELAKAEEERRRKETEAIALSEKRKQQEEERRLALEAKKAEEEERRKVEAYKKSIPIIEITQSEPDEYGAVILEISVSKPTKVLSINGDTEGASKDGKYRVKRVLKKSGKTNFVFNVIDEYGMKAALSWSTSFEPGKQTQETASQSKSTDSTSNLSTGNIDSHNNSLSSEGKSNPDPLSNPYVIGQCMAYIGNETIKGTLDAGQIAYMQNPKAKNLFDKQVQLVKKYPKCFESGALVDKCLKSERVSTESIQFALGYNTGAANSSNSSALKSYSIACTASKAPSRVSDSPGKDENSKVKLDLNQVTECTASGTILSAAIVIHNLGKEASEQVNFFLKKFWDYGLEITGNPDALKRHNETYGLEYSRWLRQQSDTFRTEKYKECWGIINAKK
jgi:hypothetical protein